MNPYDLFAKTGTAGRFFYVFGYEDKFVNLGERDAPIE
jgi:hypothetical protein